MFYGKMRINIPELSLLPFLRKSLYHAKFGFHRYRWMDDLHFYPLINSIRVISGQWEGDNERLCAVASVYSWKDYHLQPV